jgi:hypothetical protein
MAWGNEEIRYYPYHQKGEPRRRAAVTPVQMDLDPVSDEDLQVLGHLMDAVDGMNPIFQDQFEPATFVIRRLTRRLLRVAEGKDREKLVNYLTVLDLQNSPYSLLPRKNHLLEIPERSLKSMAKKAGPAASGELREVIGLMSRGRQTPRKANFYPADLTEREYESLGSMAAVVNSSVLRGPRKRLDVVLNERRYRRALRPVIAHLRHARDLTRDPDFRLYLDSKILEMETGSDEARRLADFAWIRHDSPVDVVISTAIEVYLDDYKNARGAAAGGVFLRNPAAEDLLKAIVQRVPRFEREAPWTYKKESVNERTLPKLKFVDVLTWSGDYVSSPSTTIAQSLPNDEWVRQNVGSVNMVFVNTSRAIHRISGTLLASEFLTREEYARSGSMLFDTDQVHSALHEIGHATGRMDDAHQAGQPSDYIQEEYSFLEETRAELFGLWTMHVLADDGIVRQEMVRAAHTGMLLSCLSALKFEPAQAHNKARNAIFHAFEEKGVIQRVDEEGKTRFAVLHERARQVVADLLKTVADLRSTGDKAGTVRLRERYVFADPLKPEIERRTADFPLGRGLVFPRLAHKDGRYLREWVYPEEFGDQAKFRLSL